MRTLLLALLGALALPAGAAGAVLSDVPDRSFPTTDGTVFALAREGSTIYIGGRFDHIGPAGQPGIARHNLAAVDEKGHVLPWDPGVFDSTGPGDVRALLAKDGVVYVSGFFSQAGGAPRASLAAIGPDGKATAFDAHLSDDPLVNAFAPAPEGIYVGGGFTTPTGEQGLAELRPNGTTTTDFDAGLTAGPGKRPLVEALTLLGGRLVAGGLFAGARGQEHHGLVALDASGRPQRFAGSGMGIACSNTGGRVEPLVSALSSDGSRLWVGGNFSGLGYPDPRAAARTGPLAALDAQTGVLQGTSPLVSLKDSMPPFCPDVSALADEGDVTYLAGAFDAVSHAGRAGFAAVDGRGRVLPFTPRGIAPKALLGGHRELIAGGQATDGNPLRSLARFLPDRTAPAIRSLRVEPGTFRPTGTRRVRRVARGAHLHFILSERAQLTISITRAGRSRPQGTFTTRPYAAGKGTRSLTGRLDGVPLTPGRYVLRARATDIANDRSRVSLTQFRIAAP